MADSDVMPAGDDIVARLRAAAFGACIEKGLFDTVDASRSEPMVHGVGSFAIFYVPALRPVVVKVGLSSVLADEIEFYRAAEARFDRQMERCLPAVLADSLNRDVGWFAMEAGRKTTLEETLYEDRRSLTLRADWVDSARAVLAKMIPVYRASAVDEKWSLEHYHLCGRLENLLQTPELTASARRFLGAEITVDALRHSRLVINGASYPALSDLLARLSAREPHIAQTHSSFIHGDLQIRNVIPAVEGDGYLFVDPRIKWEGQGSQRVGYGSPLYDAANFLHSVAGMSSILAHKDCGESARLCRDAKLGRGRITLWMDEEFLLQTEHAIDAMVALTHELLPEAFLPSGWRVHLLAYASNSTIGWLKSIPTVENDRAWLSMYANGVRLLSRALAYAEAADPCAPEPALPRQAAFASTSRINDGLFNEASGFCRR